MLNSNLYSIDILVNGNTCKQYNHNGKLFIEAKNGSEYEIKICNNGWSRILAVSAVDGLNVLTGEPASEEDSGYVINGHDALKIKGFRYSDDNVGAFKFSSKDASYASSKGDSKNVGVIGIRLFEEKSEDVAPIYKSWNTYQRVGNLPTPAYPNIYSVDYEKYTGSIPIYNTGATSITNWDSGILRCCNNQSIQDTSRGFDMGTDWGQIKESKVREVSFKKGSLNFTLDIYYASRESLIEMGVPLVNETKVSFPSSFPKKYATPPNNWRK